MSNAETNLQVLSPSRKKPKVGDVFALQLPDGRYLFGRVISTEAMAGPSMGGAILIYVYRERSDQKELPERAELRPDRLLVSPIMTNQQPWTKGYFETIENLPVDGDDVLDQHCFRRWDGRYFDEALNELPGPIEPVGDYGVHSYRTIDDEISDALGFDRAPD
ncbi:MAG: immunity 26/phosphotriesterase HocA family protein [Microthrixaceae bacterium]|nr:immunity 26/phosphotriesterase HocA family protein [Microthrixaceae bacterium]